MKPRELFIISYIICIFISNISAAQTFIQYGDKTFGGDTTENDVVIRYLGNNQFLLSGRSYSNISGDKTGINCNAIFPDSWSVKFDSQFNKIWDKSYGGDSKEQGANPILLSNGQLLFSVSSNSDSSCSKSENSKSIAINDNDYWIYKTDSNSNLIWDKTFGGINDDSYPHIIQLSNGNFVSLGTSNSVISDDKSVSNFGGQDYWVVSFDSVGNKIWDNVFGGTSNEVISPTNQSSGSVLAIDNGRFILAGTTNSGIGGNISVPSFGSYDIWILLVDSFGNKVWDNRFGGDKYDRANQIIKTNDGYIIVGMTYSAQGGSVSEPSIGNNAIGDVWVLKIDSLGNKQWDRRYGGIDSEEGLNIVNAPDGGFWIAAYTNSPPGFDISEPGFGLTDYWILKIDSIGNKVWDKRFGSSGNDVVSNFIIMPDTSIYLAGYASSGTSTTKTDSGKGGLDYWVVHFKYGYTFTGVYDVENSIDISISPNPSNGLIEINCNLTGSYLMSVFNVLGEKILFRNIELQNRASIDLSELKDGMYFIRFDNKEHSKVLKFIKE